MSSVPNLAALYHVIQGCQIRNRVTRHGSFNSRKHLQDFIHYFIHYAYMFYTGLPEEQTLLTFHAAGWFEPLGDLARYAIIWPKPLQSSFWAEELTAVSAVLSSPLHRPSSADQFDEVRSFVAFGTRPPPHRFVLNLRHLLVAKPATTHVLGASMSVYPLGSLRRWWGYMRQG